ncbi:MAG: glycosyl transferase [Acidimicrobiales bacterium]|jgi:glycosyltransferase involved in cell wall biosynthesis|nr:glycosyl transferase [Acidimicrobiales bacterium]
MITVLTATLGSRPTMLLEAIESVRSQTFADWEHMIVDDGSFSVQAIEGARVFQVTHRGPGPARNVGLAEARGEAVALLDDDDLWHPHHLETVWAVMQDTGADVVYADCHEAGRRDGYAIDVRDFDGDLLQRENFICVPATLVRTSALRSAGGFPAGELEDWALWKRMHAMGTRFVHVPAITVTYRFHEDNLTYGGIDPTRTAAAKRLLEDAEAGKISWEQYSDGVVEVWS